MFHSERFLDWTSQINLILQLENDKNILLQLLLVLFAKNIFIYKFSKNVKKFFMETIFDPALKVKFFALAVSLFLNRNSPLKYDSNGSHFHLELE